MRYRDSLCVCQIHYNMKNMHTKTHYKNILPPQIPPRVLNWPHRFLCIHSGATRPQLKEKKKEKRKGFDTNSKPPSAEISQMSLRLSALRLFTDKSSQLQQKLQILQSLKHKWKQPIVWPDLKRNGKICWKTTEKEHKTLPKLQLKAKGPADSALCLISDRNYGIWSWSQTILMVCDQNIIR